MADIRDNRAAIIEAARIYALDANPAAYSTSDSAALIRANRIYRELATLEPRLVTHSGTATLWSVSPGGSDTLSDTNLTFNYARWLHIFSSTISAAAAAVLGEVFPAESDYFLEQSEEAAVSRLYGGIHFRHDNEQGTAVGQIIGERVVERMRAAGGKGLLAGR